MHLSHCFIFTLTYLPDRSSLNYSSWNPHLDSNLIYPTCFPTTLDYEATIHSGWCPPFCTHQAYSCLQVFNYIIRYCLYFLAHFLTCYPLALSPSTIIAHDSLSHPSFLFNLPVACMALLFPFLGICFSLGFPHTDSQFSYFFHHCSLLLPNKWPFFLLPEKWRWASRFCILLGQHHPNLEL